MSLTSIVEYSSSSSSSSIPPIISSGKWVEMSPVVEKPYKAELKEQLRVPPPTIATTTDVEVNEVSKPSLRTSTEITVNRTTPEHKSSIMKSNKSLPSFHSMPGGRGGLIKIRNGVTVNLPKWAYYSMIGDQDTLINDRGVAIEVFK